MSAALDFRTLRAGKSVQVVMIHGLFSNGAFWIPYIDSFKDSQVTLITVDYSAVLHDDRSLDDTVRRIDNLIGDKPTHFIGHSFGCWLGMLLQTSFISRSFICPTFAAKNFSASFFCSEIARRVAVPPEQIDPLVRIAVDYKLQHIDDLSYRVDDHFYLPCDDPYFQYVEDLQFGQTHRYHGGHFDVSIPVKKIACLLLAGSIRNETASIADLL